MPERQCDFPGCAGQGQCYDKRIDGWCCTGHRPRREVPGWRDVYCQLCGFGPRATLTRHVNLFHDGKAAYIRQFGPRSLVSEDCRHNLRILLDQHLEAMGASTLRRRQQACKRGHRYTAKNTYTRERNGRIERQCRRCRQERKRRPPLPRRKCTECGKSFQPYKSDHHLCSPKCRRRAYMRAWRAKRKRQATT